jgi:hypothetical protein
VPSLSLSQIARALSRSTRPLQHSFAQQNSDSFHIKDSRRVPDAMRYGVGGGRGGGGCSASSAGASKRKSSRTQAVLAGSQRARIAQAQQRSRARQGPALKQEDTAWR